MSEDQLSFTFQLLLGNSWTAQYAGLIGYILIVLLSCIVYKLGFAKKLPILKSAIIYILLAFGSLILYPLAWMLPIITILFISSIVLIIYKIRLKKAKKEGQTPDSSVS